MLDAKFSLAVRIESKREFHGFCQFCYNAPVEQCFHFITRTKYATRWDFDNATGSCSGCNLKYEHQQEFVVKVVHWYEARNGEGSWDRLVRKSHETAKYSNEQLREIGETINRRLERR